MSWPIRVTARLIYAFSEGPNSKGALSGEMIQVPEGSNMRVVEQVAMNPRFGSRFLSKSSGKHASSDGTLKQWWAYIGKEDFQVEDYIPPPKVVEQVSVSAL